MKASSNTTNILLSSTSNIAPYIQYCETRSLDWRSVAIECGLPIELTHSNQWLPTQDLVRFIHSLERKFGYSIGIEVGRKASLEQLSPELSRKIDQCTSLEQAIRCLTIEISTLSNHVTMWTEKRDGMWWLCHRSCYHPSTSGFEQSEWFRTLTVISLCRKFIERTWQPSHAKLISANNRERKLPKHFFNSDIQFEQQYGAIAIPLPDDYRAISEQDTTQDWHQAVEVLINTYSTLPWFNIEWFATMLGMTKRTLQRNLKSNGILFKLAKEQVRKSKAKQLLDETNLSVQEISWQLGYSDLSNFNRAFKGWVGTTAPSYRSRNKKVRSNNRT
ncbi:helix-turn-helix domain-containing protein [Vibrio crassostreae]|uniref:helix-turn-helix domain-containing protein n=1 Tax=Vibrio crassostreae TaxID=246167 RepID=UPI00104C7A46|nr:AraC family transcriptional regulator [Vibrio crassostreae]TCW12692.1 AraC-like DNA-binding protein [Vibrio crassostreae]CAK3918053.1 HTH araC/xylS-type domain-containing protein [Vibrio crassostreae]